MPVHAPSARLFGSVPFRFLGGGKGGGRKATNVSLNVVPFVDMMTILVCFLLMTFSASGEIIMAQKGVELPDATNKDQLRKAPVIVVSRDAITFNGDSMGDPRLLASDNSMEWKIVDLFERLRHESQLFELAMSSGDVHESERNKCSCPEGFFWDEEQDRCEVGQAPPIALCLRGLVILQADKSTSAKVINRVLKTAYAADFRNIMFATNQRDSR